MITQTVKIKNGSLVLPKSLQRAWAKAEVFVFPSDDTLIIKKIQEPLESEWEEYEEKIRKGRKKISSKVIDEATKWAKAQS